MSTRAQPERRCKAKLTKEELSTASRSSQLNSEVLLEGGESGVLSSSESSGIVIESSGSESGNTVVGSMDDLGEVIEEVEGREPVGSGVHGDVVGVVRHAREGSAARQGRDDGIESDDELSNRELRSIIRSLSRGFPVMPSHDTSLTDRTRKVQGLAHHKDGLDIAKYVRKLEADLTDIGVPRREFKTILFQKLSSKSASQIVASIDRDDCTYEELKQTLIDSLGSGRTSLGSKLTSEFSSDVKGMNPLQKYVHLKGLMDSVNMTVGDRKDILLFFASAIYRQSLPSHQRSIMDSREITSFKELNKLALSLHTTDADRTDVYRMGRYGNYGGSQLRCYRCQRVGHRAYECKVGRDDNKPGIVCYSCQQPGHKAPDCPNRTERAPREQGKAAEGGRKYLGLKTGNKPLNASWVAVTAGTPVVSGKVNDIICEIVPDTGAEITVVPGCLVYESQILPDTIEVRGATGVPVTLCTANVEFEIDDTIFESRVAVAQQGMLNGKVLFSVPMDGPMAKRLLLGAASLLPKNEGEAGHSGDTPDTQSSSLEDAEVALSTDEVVDASQSIHEHSEDAQVRVVTRAGSWMASLAQETRAMKDMAAVDPVPLVVQDDPVIGDQSVESSMVNNDLSDVNCSDSNSDESRYVLE